MTDAASHRQPLFDGLDRLKLGVFHMNCTRGATPSTAEGTISPLDWGQQVRIARLAEDAGLDAFIPIARWRGYGGPSGFNDEQYEPIPWAAGLSALTERIAVFATAHVPLIHPVRLAKEVATIDHISGGRFCLNVVAGWNKRELDMFGVDLVPQEERYEVAAEWTSFLERLWAEDEEFDVAGKYFRAERVLSAPKPIQRPRVPIMSAGSSPAGIAFAAAHADICFAAANSPEDLQPLVARIKEAAAERGRTVSVWTQAGVLCGETEAEATRRYEHVVREQGDLEAVTNQMTMLMGGDSRTLDFALDPAMLERMVAMQHAYQLFGTPEQIVKEMQQLADIGIDGLALMWPDYERGISEFRDQVLPLAVQAGLRAGAQVQR
ncbi:MULTISPECIES: LLM class flavin-dependent oxidoreductase [Pseudonocardia]|uniref:Pyrimidine monooxygenase RutA n=2 Tax=Pseudonocardia TaxID=1847 RepID=A0A1Y2N053_PSEAH|nr:MULTISPECIES: LLM class flavin-dependent oxidoreductase [Pseudonocardia]OSY40802.1 Pyrimidine monooxygenase RutA [Pseudonocardia autotrophica]TDN71890.1 alkanesulfonate monooxygenase SsuD/methylene tetrahydromethanopterin reductase-like flavin-dependent oxidoreductase (luciferase family) [Pseudonocardia autotrophica]BBG02578.1 luciferase [Pseudonocardia autotrophica]GEC24637.1 luciferase [Pseudonocardia saturnea]